MYYAEIAVRLFVMLLLAACFIVAAVKLRASIATVFFGIAFGIQILANVPLLLMQLGFIDFSPDTLGVAELFRIGGLVSLLVGFATMPSRGAGAPVPYFQPVGSAEPSYAPPMGAMPLSPSRQNPGWGLVAAWIPLSALGWLSGFLTLALVLDAGARINSREAEVIAVSVIFNVLFMIPTVLVQMIWLYKAWDAVPESCRSASPGQAVGFLFIPFFNYYWIFRAIAGLSASIRRGLQAYEKGSTWGAGYGVGIAACVLVVIPYLGVLAWPLFLIWMCLANSAKNRLIVLSRGGR